MITEKDLRAEMKRYPRFIARAFKAKDYDEVLRLATQLETIEWIVAGE